jgi:hypothetical protein
LIVVLLGCCTPAHLLAPSICATADVVRVSLVFCSNLVDGDSLLALFTYISVDEKQRSELKQPFNAKPRAGGESLVVADFDLVAVFWDLPVAFVPLLRWLVIQLIPVTCLLGRLRTKHYGRLVRPLHSHSVFLPRPTTHSGFALLCVALLGTPRRRSRTTCTMSTRKDAPSPRYCVSAPEVVFVFGYGAPAACCFDAWLGSKTDPLSVF